MAEKDSKCSKLGATNRTKGPDLFVERAWLASASSSVGVDTENQKVVQQRTGCGGWETARLTACYWLSFAADPTTNQCFYG